MGPEGMSPVLARKKRNLKPRHGEQQANYNRNPARVFRKIKKHLGMKVKVVSRQKYGAIEANFKIAPYSFREKKVE